MVAACACMDVAQHACLRCTVIQPHPTLPPTQTVGMCSTCSTPKGRWRGHCQAPDTLGCDSELTMLCCATAMVVVSCILAVQAGGRHSSSVCLCAPNSEIVKATDASAVQVDPPLAS